MSFKLSKRMVNFPPYLFAEIDRQKNVLKKRGKRLIDVSIGDPDIPAPRSVARILGQAACEKDNQKYALDRGKENLRLSIRNWMRRRFRVSLSEDNQILPLIGSKEGLVHFPLAFVDPGQYVIVPSPGYPGYRGAALFAGAKIHELPLREENGFLPELNKIPLHIRNKARLIYVNYPNNPTTALAPKSFLMSLVRFCSRHGIIIAYDNAYSEVYFDKKPASIMEIPGAKEIAIEFHSLSKTFCMTGFRIGWACGSNFLIQGLLKVKTNVDSGVFGAIQDAGAWALENEQQYMADLRKKIKARRDMFVAGLNKKGFSGVHAASTFYVWVKIPPSFARSIDYAQYLLKRGVVATPGLGFGGAGEGYIRFALTTGVVQLKRALALL